MQVIRQGSDAQIDVGAQIFSGSFGNVSRKDSSKFINRRLSLDVHLQYGT